MSLFSEQIERASSSNKKIILMGDANLDSNKWNDSQFAHSKVAAILKGTLEQNGIKIHEIGSTYQADHAQKMA